MTPRLNQLSHLHIRPIAEAQQALDDYLGQHPYKLSDCLTLAEKWGRSPLSYWLLTRRLTISTVQDAIQTAQTLIKLAYLDEAATLLNAFDDDYVTLQRGVIHYWRGDTAAALIKSQDSYRLAKVAKDAVLAIASLTLEGEVLLSSGNAKQAVIRFGKALGLTEYSSDTRLTILPLAGLGHAQHAWGYPEKAAQTLHKALSRAKAHKHQQGLCRAYQALALATDDKATHLAACHSAKAIPHLPLWIQSHLLAERQGVSLETMSEALTLRQEAGILK
jgi:hypothetical protein